MPQTIPLITFKGFEWPVSCLEFSPDSDRLYGHANGKVAIGWSVATGKKLLSLKHKGELRGPMAFMPDGKRLLTAALNGRVSLWDSTSGIEIAQSQWKGVGGFSGVAIDPASDTAVAVEKGPKGTVFRFKPDDLKLLSKVDVGPGQHQLSKNGCRLLVWPGDAINRHPKIYLWDLVSGTLLLEVVSEGAQSAAFFDDKMIVLRPFALGFSNPDYLTVWDLRSKGEIRRHTGVALAATFSSNGEQYIYTTNDQKAFVVDLKTGDTISSFDTKICSQALATSRDGKLLATGYEGAAAVWDFPSLLVH